MKKESIVIFWYRRDLRVHDNVGLYHALISRKKVLPLFIFDQNILMELPDNDSRITFIYKCLNSLQQIFSEYRSSIIIEKGQPIKVFKKLINQYNIDSIYTNHDYEPYAVKRDIEIRDFVEKNGVHFLSYKDQSIFEKKDILKPDGKPYTIYTPYSKKWKQKFNKKNIEEYKSQNFLNQLYVVEKVRFPNIKNIGFTESKITVAKYDISKDLLTEYEKQRDLPSKNGTSMLSVHLRFGTVSIREVLRKVGNNSEIFLKELIWRDFFMQILYHFPQVVSKSFKKKYDAIPWENNEVIFKKWCEGKTGYPIVDAGMRQLNQTGWMHNRIRMIVASFLCKHLLIDWRWGESYFARKLLDYELSSNNGNWQWAAGCGCDAAPYFRVFNPTVQQKKFDPKFEYIKKWIPEFKEGSYLKPLVEHKESREKAIKIYKLALA